MKPDNIQTIVELSPMQQAMLFHSLMAPGSGVYVLQMSLRLTGGLDLPAFGRAWRSLVARHSILRTAFFWEDLETPRQVVFREVALEIPRTSWSGLSGAEQEERLAGFLAADRARGFELSEAPLLRLALFELAEDVHQLVWTQHHLVTDGWSQGLVLRELLQSYKAFAAGCEPALAPVPGFHNYLTWLKRQDLGAAEAFWRRSLEGFSTPTFLMAGKGRVEEPDGTDARRRDLALPRAVSAALREVARRRRLTLNTLVQGGWALLLAQESGQDDVVFGATVAGRPADLPGVESIVGPFLNTLPLRVEVAPERRLHEWLGALQAHQVEARRHEHAPLVDVQRWSAVEPGLALFDHILVFENLTMPEELARPFPGLEIVEESASSLTNYPLNVVIVPGQELLLSLRWDGTRYGEPEAVRLLERLARLLTAFAEDGDPRLGELPLLLLSERHQLLREWNDTADVRRSDLLLHELFAAQAELRPDALAAVWEESAWTYRELAERAHRLAVLLRGLGVDRGTPVGVWMERSLDMIAGVLGILEAGGTYIPLDASWPADRVETILIGTGAPVILCGRATLPVVERLRWRLPRLGDAVCLEVETPEPEPEALDTAAIRSLFDFVAERATDRNDRVMAGGFVSRRTGLPFSEAEVDEYRDRVLSLAEPWLRPGARVLEVGCGSGLILWEMAPRVERCVGLDPSELTQERNRGHARAAGIGNVELPVGFAHEIGARFTPGSFDLVLLASTVQFFPGPRYLEKMVAEALALLAPGGALLLADVIDARREPVADTLALDERLFHDLGRAEIHHRTEGFANELGERYDVLLQPGETARRKRTWTGWHVDQHVGRAAQRDPPTGLPVGSPEDVAYVIHTSGSTGLPKGIAVQHAPAVNLIRWVNRTLGVGPADRLLFVTSLSFDLSVWDIFGILAAGGTVHVASEAALREPAELVRLLCTEPITVWDSAPAALQQLAPLFPQGLPRPLRLVMLSGDWIPVPLPDQVRAAFPGARVISLGGATEATVWSNWYPVEAVDPRWPSIPYGRPISNARYHCLNAGMRPCPIGVAGDLYIGGGCLSVGYTGPALTAAAFLPDPFAGEPGARLYRTGDRVRFFPDGNLEFLGRVDQQVKVHGYRIELGEIEVALLRHRQVREAVVQVLDGRLVAWVVPGDDIAPEAQALRAWLAESLPSYMLPSAYVILAALPVTPNGKLDRQALPAPELAQAAEYVAPSGPGEEMLAALWGELLGIERVGAGDNFFTLGGHSLLGTRVVSRLREAFGVDVPLRDLFEAPTVAELAARVEAALRTLRAGAGRITPPLVPVAPALREGSLPLSFAQQRLWFIDQLEPGSPLYNIPVALRVEGTLDVRVLALCLGEIVRRHEALRTVFATQGGVAVQVIRPAAPFPLPLVDLSGLPEDRREPLALALAGEEAGRPFDLARGPLLRGALMRLAAPLRGQMAHVVALTMHHIASDAWSMGLLVREVGALYAAFSAGRPSPLPELPVQYADFAAWQGSWLRGEVLEEEISFWRQQLADLPLLLELPTDRPRPAVQSFRGAARPMRLPAGLTRQVETLGRSAGATLFMVLLAGLQTLLARLSGQPDLAVGTPVAGRNRIETEELIGFFVNTLVLRSDLSGNLPGGRADQPTFLELLGRVRETALAAYLHQEVPFERLVQELAPERSLAHAPVFQVMLVLQNAPMGELSLPGLRLTPWPAVKSRTEFDLDLTWSADEAGLAGALTYAADLFDASTMERFAGHLVRLLAGAVEDPDRPLVELPLLAAEERHQLLVEWSGGAAPVAPLVSSLVAALVPGLFAAQAERTPEAVAVSFSEGTLTYAELARRASSLAGTLRACGVGPEVVVAVFVDRSPDLPASLLGVLAAGGAYVPLDPATPRERLAFLLEDCGAAVVLTQRHLEARLPPTRARVLLLDEVPAMAAELPDWPPVRPHQAAYAIYTSGSTGLPKGAIVTHRALASFALAYIERLGLTAEDRVLQLAALGFDVVVEEIFPTLLAGGRVVLRDPQELATTYGLMRAIEEEGVTTVELPTAFWHDWVFELERTGERPPACLRRVLTGTERLLPERLDAWRPFGASLVHVFGLTEVTVTSMLHVVPPGDGEPAPKTTVPPPVGRPFGGTRAWLLDEELREVPVGVPGELYLGGPGVARGYLRRPDLTAERFLPDPLCGAPGARMYRSGDRLRWLPDGTLDFLGRLDRQVKVRGFRIELGEVESALSGLPGVSQTVVIVRDQRLIAYLVGDASSGAELRRLLGERLPESMVPAAFVWLAVLPLTPNGKVDRKALPAPELQGAAASYLAPRTPVEEVLAGIWAEVLGLERVGADGHFFDLGGHSLLATQVLSRLRGAFGVEMPLRDLFEAPMLADLAARVETARLQEGRRSGMAAVAPPLVPVPREGPLPLSFAQQRLWFIDQLEPGSPLYNMPVALRIEGSLDAGVLARCLGEIERRHESLRTVFAVRDGTPVQVVLPAAPFHLPVVDLSGLSAVQPRHTLALIGEEASRPFDLAHGPLLRGVLLRLAAPPGGQIAHVVALTLHHIASDGWSMGILVREITALYAAFAAGRPSPLPELPVQYADFAVWQRSWLQGAALEEQLGYWTRRLAGAPQILDLPTDRPRPPVHTYRGAVLPFALPSAPSRALPALCRREGVTPFMVLLAAWGVLLGRHAGQDDLLVGSPVAGRNQREVEDLIGFFINTLVFRLEPGASTTFGDLLRRVREAALGAFAHQDVPFERIVEALVHERNLAVPPLVQVLFVHQNTPAGVLRVPGLTIADLEAESGAVRFDLTLNLSETPDGLAAVLEHSTDLFDRATVERLMTRYAALLEEAVADPGRALGELPLLGPEERHQVLAEWNDTARSYRTGVTLHELVAEQAVRTPELVAASFEGEELTYRELEERAGALAGRLVRLGIEPEDRVGVRMERSLDLIVALLATLKAGAAYVPLDPSWPAERLRQIAASAGARVVLPEEVAFLEGASLEGAAPNASPGGGGGGDQGLAYVLFTSGSTGVPKGVMIPHAGIVNRLLWMQEAYGLTPADRVLQKTPFTFDVSVWEFFWPLLVGARLVLARPEGHKDPAYLAGLIAREKITTLHFVPSMLQAFLEAPGLEALASVHRVMASGEALPPELVRRFFARLPHAELHNLYGPTEASVDVSFWPCVPEPPRSVVPIGRPISNLRLHVMNRDLRPVPIGVAGELLLGGVGLARGYLGRPELTAVAFVPDPCADRSDHEPGARLYRTGDLARFLPDGQVEFLGRIDFQVKVRGFRIELGEIEAALAALPGVREAVVVARSAGMIGDLGGLGDLGDRRLVAYVVGDTAPDVLRGQLSERLPDYMVPSVFVLLEALPLTPSGKVDRKALPTPERQASEEAWQAPRTPVEEVLAGIWAELLGLERVGVADRFFDLGGHSLLATQVMSRLRRAFGVEMPLRDLFEAPALEDLAVRVEAALRADQVALAPPLVPIAPVLRHGPLPLSFAQQRLWFIDQLEPGSALYNLPLALRIAGRLDAGVLERALQKIVHRHEALRTVFAVQDGSPVQVIRQQVRFELPLVDLSGLPERSREALALSLAGEEAQRPFDLGVLGRGPLLRGLLLRLATPGEQMDHAVALTMHHIASDGWSLGILLREVAAFYTELSEDLSENTVGRPSPLAELPVQYADFAAWQRSWLQGEVLEEEVGFWRQQLADLPPLLELPTDRPRPAMQSFRGALRPVRLPAGFVRQVKTLGRREGATLFMVLLAGFQALLARYSGQQDLAVGSPIAGRNRVEIEGLIGFFVNTLVLRGDLSGNLPGGRASEPSFRELLGRTRETALVAYVHQDVPFERVVEELAPERSLAHAPLFQVMFAVENASAESLEIPNLRLRPLSSAGTTAKFDLTFNLEERSGEIGGTIEYATDLFDPTTVDRLILHFETLLTAALAAPELPVSLLSMLDEVERHQLLAEWGGMGEKPPASSLHGRFEAQVQQAPEATALTCGGANLSYGELNRRSNQLARRLRQLGAGLECRVGLCLERSPDLVVGILGVLKAGGAYVPLDPGSPRERLAYMIEDAGIQVVVTKEHVAVLPDTVSRIFLDAHHEMLETLPDRDLEPLADGASLAYVIYTSGSTGHPKGALITHGNVARLFDATEDWFGFGERDVWTLFHSYAFDFSVWEIWGALLYGGRLVIVPWEVSRSPEMFLDLLIRERVTVLNQTPSAFAQLAQVDAERGGVATELRLVIFGGEALDPAGLASWFARHGDARPLLVNMYGITETTVHVTYRPLCAADSRGERRSLIGGPIPDLSLAVVDAWLQPVPIGVPGELVVGGAGLARGYLGRPELTAERFVPDPAGGSAGARLYRSGDLGRFLARGEVEYLGRIDHQVKIRGFRIELGEIEAVLAVLPEVREAVVVARSARSDGPGDRRLVAYLVGDVPPDAELRRLLSARLPDYMVPVAFVRLAALPLTPNGKVDRKALPAPERPTSEETWQAPRTPVEEVLAGIWAELLGVERVGVADRFFDLGGHSLLATQAMSRLRAAFGVEMPLRDLFEAPTLADLAARVETALRTDKVSLTPRLAAVPRHGPLPLSFAQQRLWFIDQLEPGSALYNIPVALRLTGSLDPGVLELALGKIVGRHEALRTVFAVQEGAPVQVIQPVAPFALLLVDLSGLPEHTREALALALTGEEAGRPFDLGVSGRGPLLRGLLLRLDEGDHVAALTMHHIASDGWSLGILVREVSALYAALAEDTEGSPSPLPELPVQYADFAAWQGSWLRGEVLEEEISFWSRQLAGLPPLLELPTDRPRPAVQSFRGATRPVRLPAGLFRQLGTLGRREGATLFMALLAGFQALLARHSGQEDLAVGSPVAGRNRVEIEGLIGFFVNTLVLRGDLQGGPSFRDLLGRVRETSLAAYLHQDVPFEKLIEELAPERSLAQTPLFQVVLNLQNAPVGSVEIPGLRLTPWSEAGAMAKFDLTLGLQDEAGGGLAGTVEYATDLFDATTVDRLIVQFETLLAAALAEPERPVPDLPVLGAAERHQVLVEWNDSRVDRDETTLIHQPFEAWATRTPDAVAAVCGDEVLTYGELEERANRLADHLAELGVGPGSLVGLHLRRGLQMIPAVLAVLKAGAAYVPLEIGHPPARLRWIVETLEISCLLTETAQRDNLPAVRHVICLDQEELTGPVGRICPNAALTPDALAYIIFTSGSTGTPKGVMVRHRPVINLFRWAYRTFAFSPADRVLFVTALSFDLSVFDIFGLLGAGGSIRIATEDEIRDPERLLRALADEPITFWDSAPAALEQTVPFLATVEAARPTALRLVFLSGDWIPVSLPDRIRGRFPGARVISLGGATEATVWSNVFPIAEVDAAWTSIPYGRPIENARYHVLDPELAPCPVGVPGDLYIGGDCLADGYAREPELTAQKFIPDPWSRNGRLYRTGDRARYRPEGNLEFLGRRDHQVKIRGFRIELGEIEAALSSLPGVREAVVVVREDAGLGGRRLVAYVAGDVSALAAEEMRQPFREQLRERLPEYMVPAAFVLLGALPLTPNGKVDRKALPAPEQQSAGESYLAPRTPVEELLAGFWAELLGLDRVGADAHFFDLGGHSLLATQVMSRLRSAFGVEMPLRDLFEAPVLAALAARVEAALIKENRRSGVDAPVPPLVPVPRDGPLPLSFAQQRLWFIDQLEPGLPLYNIPVALRATGPLDAGMLALCLEEIVRRHQALRTVFAARDGAPVQMVRPAAPFALPLVDLSGLPESRREPEAFVLAGGEAGRPFDLTRDPLLRGVLLRLAEEDHVAALTMHHIASDGWSMGILVREFATLYPAFAEGWPSPLAELPVQYADFAVWQRSWLHGEVLEEEISYWRRQLAGLPPLLELPTDRPRPAVQSFRGAEIPMHLSAASTRQAETLARREGVTLFMVLLAGFQALLARASGQSDLAVGSPVAGRNRMETEGLIGLFVNTLVLRSDLSGAPSFRELLGRVRSATLAAYTHQDVPFEKLVEELAPERSLAQTPLFQVMLTLQNAPVENLEIPGLRLRPVSGTGATAMFDLSLTLEEWEGGLAGGLEYVTDLFDRPTVGRLAVHFERLLAEALAAPDLPVGALSLLTGAERHQLLLEWNDTADLLPDECLHHSVAAQAARRPTAVAVELGSETWTWRRLLGSARLLARHLRTLGVGPDMVVGLCAERSPSMVAGMLGVLEAGGTLLPLEAAHPPERLGFLLDNADARVLLIQESLVERVPAGGRPVVLLGERWDAGEDPGEERNEPLGVEVSPDHLALVLYTSGSTGQPKGVMLPHRGIANRLRWARQVYGIDERDAFLQKASLGFDVSFWECFGALTAGARLVLAEPGRQADGAYLVRTIREHRVTLVDFVPAMLAAFLAAEDVESCVTLRQIFVGGEALGPELRDRVLARLPIPLDNMYGPTEISIDTTRQVCAPGQPQPPHQVPIGQPIANSRLYVVDRELRPVAIGVAGELLVGGTGVTRGYLRRPDLTAERYIPDPFSARPGDRVYRTGDLARWLPDGTLDFRGRVDDQVKIRGIRIELGEVGQALAALPGVREAAVLALPGRSDRGAGDLRLVAYVVLEAAGEPAAVVRSLRDLLRERLPDALVPSVFVPLAALPLLPSGKLDRKALPEPEQDAEDDWQAPRTPVEEVLAGIWAEVLGLERVGAGGHFFDLGGHSLLATQVLSRLRSVFGIELPLRELFEAPVLSDLAVRVEAARRIGAGTAAPAPPLVPVPRQGPLPLSFAQQRLWFIDQLEPGSPLYNMPVALGIEGPLDTGVLARCLGEIESRHESLRTVFAERDGAPVQIVLPAVPFVLPMVDLSGLPAGRRETQVRVLVGEEATRPFDLAHGPLLRGVLLRGEGDHIVALTMHHIASDGWSMNVLVREITSLYAAFVEGRPSSLPELPVQYADFAVWQHSWLRGEVLEDEVSFWRRQLADLPPLLELPTDRPRPAVQSYRGASLPPVPAPPPAPARRPKSTVAPRAPCSCRRL